MLGPYQLLTILTTYDIMYLPLAGWKEEKEREYKMKISPIAATLIPNAVRPASASPAAQPETQKLGPPESNNGPAKAAKLADSETENSVERTCVDALSTQDFLVLRAQTLQEESPYKVLDEVIARMKENVEEAGEALEALVKMIKETSDSSIALKLLEKTFEAIDEMNGKQK